MSDTKPAIGSVGWIDLTVPNAIEVRDFYRQVVGWKHTGLSMGDYEDFVMSQPAEEKAVSGICHAKEGNAELPPYWLIYITVANLDESILACNKLGGKVISGPKSYGDMGRYCIIQDPAGAYSALFENI